MTEVRFFNERGRDRFEEYLDVKRRRPAQAAAIRDAITLIAADPGKAERDYITAFVSARSRKQDLLWKTLSSGREREALGEVRKQRR